jgi:hypothetical protein
MFDQTVPDRIKANTNLPPFFRRTQNTNHKKEDNNMNKMSNMIHTAVTTARLAPRSTSSTSLSLQQSWIKRHPHHHQHPTMKSMRL